MRADGQRDITKLIVGFRKFANAPKKVRRMNEHRNVSAAGILFISKGVGKYNRDNPSTS